MTETANPGNPSQPAGAAAPQPDSRVVRNVYLAVFNGLMHGDSAAGAVKALTDSGLDHDVAAKVVQNVQNFIAAFAQAVKSSGLKNALFGALWCIGGTAVTVLTYEAASGGGTYFVAWGAILFGAIQAIRGLAMLGRKPQPADLLKAFNL
jgi:hypothetical protein